MYVWTVTDGFINERYMPVLTKVYAPDNTEIDNVSIFHSGGGHYATKKEAINAIKKRLSDAIEEAKEQAKYLKDTLNYWTNRGEDDEEE